MVTQKAREWTKTTPVAKTYRFPKFSWSLVACALALAIGHSISCAQAARSFGMRMDGEKVSNRVSARSLLTDSSTSFPLCDFFLYPGNGTVPSISLDGSSDTGVGPYVMDSVSGQIIEVDSSGKASFLCSDMAGTSAGDQFYVNGQQAQIKFRTFNSNPKSYFENSCFVIPLTAVQIPSGNSVLNLNPGDSNQQSYPDDRRCLVFATGPSTASCTCSPSPVSSPPPPSPPPPSPSPPRHPPPSPSPPPPSPPPPPPSPPPPSPSPPPPSPPPPPPPSPSPPPPSPPPPPPPSPPPPPPPSPPPPPACNTSCPSSPLELCDFYFAGYKSEIPTIGLVNGEGTSLSPGLRTNKTGAEVVVEVDESGSALFRECPSATNSVGNQFYLNGEDAVLKARTFQTTPGIDYFRSRCVLLPINVLRIAYKGVAFNVPADDTENLFTSARRCVMFKTS